MKNMQEYILINAIKTYTGRIIDPLNPSVNDITIVDIAHALSYIPRFNGHTQRFYSVAEHSIHVCEILRRAYPNDFDLHLAGLLHDASEAYLLDIPSPVKKRIPGYSDAETALMQVICRKFNIWFPMDDRVKEADTYMLNLEWIELMNPGSGAVMTAESFKAISGRFLKLFDILTNKLS